MQHTEICSLLQQTQKGFLPSHPTISYCKSSPSATSAAKPAVIIHNQASVGIFPFPWHPAFLQQAGLRNDIKLRIPAGKKWLHYLHVEFAQDRELGACLSRRACTSQKILSGLSLLGCVPASEVQYAALLLSSTGVFLQW